MGAEDDLSIHTAESYFIGKFFSEARGLAWEERNVCDGERARRGGTPILGWIQNGYVRTVRGWLGLRLRRKVKWEIAFPNDGQAET